MNPLLGPILFVLAVGLWRLGLDVLRYARFKRQRREKAQLADEVRRMEQRARRGIDPSRFSIVDQLDDAQIFVFPRNGVPAR